MGIKPKFLAVLAAIALFAGIGAVSAAPAQAASVKAAAGTTCTVAKKTAKVGKTALVCKKNAKGKLVWTKTASVVVTPKQTTTTSVTSNSQPVSSQPVTTSAATPSPVPTSPSGYPIVIDPNAGGSNEVVYPDPSDSEQHFDAKPVAPTNLRIVELTDHSVKLTHDGVSGVENYSVYLRYGDSYTLKGTSSAQVSVDFTDLAPGWDYVACAYYSVNNVESNKSCLNVHTLGATPVEPVLAAGPTNVQLTSTETTISASWNAVAGATWYSICHVRVDSWQCGGYTMLSATSAIFQDGSIYAGWRYGIQITAVFEDGSRSEPTMTYINSKGSQPPPPTKLPAPTNLRIIDLTPTSVTVAWDDPANSVVTVWSVVTRYQTSYTAQGGYPDQHQFTSTAIWAGGGFEIIVSGYNSETGKWTEEAKIGFFAPNN
jgi:hypothetical protein